ncbi:MAG: O-antigen ligase family protein [Pirellulaceae bacterium]
MLLFSMLVAAIGLVWGAVLLRHGSLLTGCLVVVGLACCLGADFYSARIGPLPLTSDRLALAGLTVIYLLGRLQGRIPALPWDRFDLVFAGFLGMLTLNTLTHDWRFRDAQPLSNLLFLYFVPAAVYCIVRESELSPRNIRLVHGCLGLFSVYLALTAIAEVKQVSAVVFPGYILSSANQEWLGRGRGPFLNPVTNGLYLSAGIFAWSMFWRDAGRLGRMVLVGLIALVFAGVYCTLTRSCWLGAAAGLLLIAVASVPTRWRVPLLAGCLLAGLGLAALKGSDFNSFKRDKNVSEHDMAQSAQLRPILAAVAMKIVRDYPVFGCGFGQYKKVDRNYFSARDVNMPIEVARKYVQHNVLLAVLTETGIVGITWYVLLWAGWLYRAWRLWRSDERPWPARQHGLLFVAFFVAWAINGMFHDTSLMMNANLLVCLLAGMSQGLGARQPATIRDTTHGAAALVSPRWPWTMPRALQQAEQGYR